jgi:hypothetical protein
MTRQNAKRINQQLAALVKEAGCEQADERWQIFARDLNYAKRTLRIITDIED